MQIRNITRPVIALAVIAGLGALLVSLFSGSDEQKAPPATGVELAQVLEQALEDRIIALGTAQSNASIIITSTVPESIARLNFTDGQRVQKGDVIVTLTQQEEQAQLAAARARLKESGRELKRAGTLVSKNALAQRDLDQRRTTRDVTEQEIKEIEARIEDRTLRAPFAGKLGVARLSTGALVEPGDIITTLDAIDRIKLDFTVPSMRFSALASGVPVIATSDAVPGRIFKGEIATVDTRIDPVTRAVLVRAILPNPDEALRPGMLMRVTLLENRRKGLIIPEEAVLQQQDAHYVYYVGPDVKKVEKRKIEIGLRKPGLVEVTSGLAAGDTVIIRGLNKVRPGQEVAIAKLHEDWAKEKENK